MYEFVCVFCNVIHLPFFQWICESRILTYVHRSHKKIEYLTLWSEKNNRVIIQDIKKF